jgi:endonuclease III
MNNRKKAALVIKNLTAAYPDSKTSLKYRTPFQLLVATILSAQSTDVTANKVASKIFKKYKTIKSLAHANPLELEKDIYSSGFYKTKSRNIIAAAEMILSEFNGKVPQAMGDLLRLPGVGRKTANIILSGAFKKAEGIAVDTHVKRIANRLCLTKTLDADKIEQDLLRIVPHRHWIDFNYMLVRFGRAICRSRKPLCAKCTIRKFCCFKKKTHET